MQKLVSLIYLPTGKNSYGTDPEKEEVGKKRKKVVLAEP